MYHETIKREQPKKIIACTIKLLLCIISTLLNSQHEKAIIQNDERYMFGSAYYVAILFLKEKKEYNCLCH